VDPEAVRSKVQAKAASLAINYPVLVDSKNQLGSRAAALELPTTLIIRPMAHSTAAMWGPAPLACSRKWWLKPWRSEGIPGGFLKRARPWPESLRWEQGQAFGRPFAAVSGAPVGANQAKYCNSFQAGVARE